MKSGLPVLLLLLLGGCAVLQRTRGPGVADVVPTNSPLMLLLVEMGESHVLKASEITVLVPPNQPAAYWTCLREPSHRAAAEAEMNRLILAWRWRPNLPVARGLSIPHLGRGVTHLRSLGPDRGLVDGVAIKSELHHAYNGNVVFLQAPLPPLPNNPCGALLSVSAPAQ